MWLRNKIRGWKSIYRGFSGGFLWFTATLSIGAGHVRRRTRRWSTLRCLILFSTTSAGRWSSGRSVWVDWGRKGGEISWGAGVGFERGNPSVLARSKPKKAHRKMRGGDHWRPKETSGILQRADKWFPPPHIHKQKKIACNEHKIKTSWLKLNR